MSQHLNFWNLYPLYMKQPPVHVDPADNVLKRHQGSSSQNGFWAGYDGIGGVRMGMPDSVIRTAYCAGVAYRKLVDSDKRGPLPNA